MAKNDNAFAGYGASKMPLTEKDKKKKPTTQPKTGPNKKPTMTQMPGRNTYETAQQRREREAGL